jgi:hypothetical protein
VVVRFLEWLVTPRQLRPPERPEQRPRAKRPPAREDR